MENETVVLAVTCDSDHIRMRIDRNGLARPDFEQNSVTVLELESCKYDDEIRDILLDSVGKSVNYEVRQAGKGFEVSFWIDYHDEEYKVTCAQIHSTYSDTTLEELKSKCERLASAYLAGQRYGEVNSFLYQTLVDRIQKEAQKEIDICQRKIKFFRENEPEKANRFVETLRISQRILALTGIEDEQDLRILIRKKLTNLWDEDGFEYQMEQNRRIRAEIVSMGEAAIFPLLEMLTVHDPLMRKEILNFIEKIDPELFYWIQKKLDFD